MCDFKVEICSEKDILQAFYHGSSLSVLTHTTDSNSGLDEQIREYETFFISLTKISYVISLHLLGKKRASDSLSPIFYKF